MVVCLWTAAWPSDLSASSLPAELLAIVPRITMADDAVWADIRGLPMLPTAQALQACAVACGVGDARLGVAEIPVVAELRAKSAAPGSIDADSEIAPKPLALICEDERLLTLLDGVGVRTCGELAALEREAVEVRFGANAVQLWHWSRGEDERRLFTTSPSERLHASTDFIDYVVTDPERLIFVANALFSTVCDRMRARGEHARRIRMTLTLANQTCWQRTIRPARPTASRAVWLRLTRTLLEKLTVPDAVTGVLIEVEATEPAAAVQGDLFDVGFATASALESAVGRLIELQGTVLVKPLSSLHARAEQRTEWQADALSTRLLMDMAAQAAPPELRLQLLPEPREVLVETVQRRDHIVPVRYRDGAWRQIVTVAGPDRISGGRWDDAYAREYFRAVGVDGRLVWLFRDAKTDRWFVQGHWD
jgi:protein ImuB